MSSPRPPAPSASDNPERFIQTEEVRRDLHRRSARSGVIQMTAQTLQLIGYVIGGVTLARLLTPADFGLFAMAGTLTVVVGTIRDFGFPMATVHQEDLDHERVSALFRLTVKLSLLLFGLMLLSAPVLAWLYREPRLRAITMILALGTLALGMSVQHESLLVRQMRFGALRLIDAVVVVVGLGTGIGLALAGAGYWALVWQVVAMEVSRAIGTWVACGWRPSLTTSRDATADLTPLLSYAKHLTGFQVLMKLARNMDRVLVGYFGGAAAAGLYYNADRWAMYPIAQVFPPLQSVAVTGLSRLQHDPPAFRDAWRKATLLILSVVVPGLVFLCLEARRTVLVMMGPQWGDSVPIFRLLCLAALAVSVDRLTKWLYLAVGTTKRQFRWGLISAPVLIVAVSIGVHWGPVGAAAGFAIASWLLLVPGISYCFTQSHVRWQDLERVIWRPAAAAAIAGLVLLLVAPTNTGGSIVVDFVLRGVGFSLAYLLAWVGLPGGRDAVGDTIRIVSSIRAPFPSPPVGDE